MRAQATTTSCVFQLLLRSFLVWPSKQKNVLDDDEKSIQFQQESLAHN